MVFELPLLHEHEWRRRRRVCPRNAITCTKCAHIWASWFSSSSAQSLISSRVRIDLGWFFKAPTSPSPSLSPESPADRRPQQTNTFARFTQHEFSKAGNQSYAAAVDHGFLYSNLGMKSPLGSDAMKLCVMNQVRSSHISVRSSFLSTVSS